VRRGFGVLVLYAALTIFFTWPQAAHMGSMTVAHIDPPFSVWRLSWVAHQLWTRPAELFDANIFWPKRRTLAYSDAMLLEGTLATPFIRAGITPLAVMNALLLVGICASAFAMYVLAHRLTGHTIAAIFAGVVFAFSSYRREHVQHLELQWAMWMPLALWAFHRAVEMGRFRDGLLTGVFVTLQFLSSIYYGLFLTTFMGLVAPLVMASRRFRVGRWALAGFAAGAIVLAWVAHTYSQPYKRVQRELGHRPVSEVRNYSAEPINFLGSAHENLLYAPLVRLGKPEARMFPGATPVALAVAALVPPVNAGALVYLAGLAFSTDAALGSNGRVFPLLREWIPPYLGLRAPARFGIIVQLALGILAAYGLARLTGRIKGRHGTWIGCALIAIVCLEYMTKPLFLVAYPTQPTTLYQWLARQPRLVTLELPTPTPLTLPGHDTDYMYFSIWHWQPLINGYSGHYSSRYVDLTETLKDFPDARSIAELKRLGVQMVLVHTELYGPQHYREIEYALQTNPQFKLMGAWRDHLGEARAYAFLPQ
jgi:hypothetical protein